MNSYNGFTPSERMAAYRWLMAEYDAGRRQRPTTCDACGQTEGVIEPHSEDYSHPYGKHIGAFGLCYRCHLMLHCRFKNPCAWDAYREEIRQGKRAEPLHTRDWGAIVRHLGGHAVTYTQHEPPARPVLDEIHSGRYLNRGGPASSEIKDGWLPFGEDQAE